MAEIVPAKTVGQTAAVANLARMCEVPPDEIVQTLMKVVMPGASPAEFIAFAQVCGELRLNPLKKEIYAFKRGDKPFVPMIGIDGWLTILNRHPDFDGMEITYKDNEQTGKPFSCTVSIRHKARSHPVVITEFFDEVRQNTPPWTQFPRRMLRHKTIAQAARVAFGFVGVEDYDSGATSDIPVVPATESVRSAAGSSSSLNERLKALPVATEPEPEPEREIIDAEPNEPEPAAEPQYEWRAPEPWPETRIEFSGGIDSVVERKGRSSPYVAIEVGDGFDSVRLLCKDLTVAAPLLALKGRTVACLYERLEQGNRLLSIRTTPIPD